MTINFTDFGLTSAIDPTDPTQVTADAQLRVSAIADSLGLIADYTQAADANKARYSRSDNRENLVLYSEDISNAAWTKLNTTAPDATTWLATAGNNAKSIDGTSQVFVAGRTYVFRWRHQAGTHNFTQYVLSGGAFAANSFFNLDLSTGTIGTIGAGLVAGDIQINALGGGIFDVILTKVATTTASVTTARTFMVASNTAAVGSSLNAVGTETIIFHQVQTRSSLTDSTYLPTTDHPQYAGVNGRRWLVLNGTQVMQTTSTIGDIWAAGAKLMYIPHQAFIGQNGSMLFSAQSGRVQIDIRTTNRYNFQHVDTVDTKILQMPNNSTVANEVCILRARQEGGFLYLAKDTGAGFGAESSLASTDSAAATLTSLMALGNYYGSTAFGFYGKIGGMFTANTGLAKPNFENLLREYYFARSQLIWDPYLAELVLKRPTVIG